MDQAQFDASAGMMHGNPGGQVPQGPPGDGGGGAISLSAQAELELELSLRGSLLVQQQRRIVQLEDELQRAWALGDGRALRPELLTPEEGGVAAGEGAPVELAALEQWAIDRALELAGGNKAEAARLLGIGRRTLYDKLRAREKPE